MRLPSSCSTVSAERHKSFWVPETQRIVTEWIRPRAEKSLPTQPSLHNNSDAERWLVDGCSSVPRMHRQYLCEVHRAAWPLPKCSELVCTTFFFFFQKAVLNQRSFGTSQLHCEIFLRCCIVKFQKLQVWKGKFPWLGSYISTHWWGEDWGTLCNFLHSFSLGPICFHLSLRCCPMCRKRYRSSA